MSQNWTPESVLLIIVVAAAVLIPALSAAAVAIIFAKRGDAKASEAALNALQKTGVPQSITSLNAQVTEIAKLTPPPPTVVQITAPQETPKP